MIMSDKNFVERKACKEIFPSSQLLICISRLCISHVQQIFKRQITTKMNISVETKNKALNILNKMIYCESEKEYLNLYTELVGLHSVNLKQYFDKCWHKEDIRKE